MEHWKFWSGSGLFEFYMKESRFLFINFIFYDDLFE